MKPQLKPVEEQVMVITGASSGIGLSTARLAAERGARVVLASRGEESLARIVDQIRARGGDARYVVCDVADEGAVQNLARQAVEAYGRVDTWINDAAVAVYGRLTQIPIADARRLIDVNFWGVVHGCNAAIPLLRETRGALITVGSVLSDISFPLQGFYVAAKHAVKGYIDTLRIELQHDGVPISVSLVKPTSIDTPFPEHARSYLGVEPKLPGPLYDPVVVAETILTCAERPVPEIYVGGSGVGFVALDRVSQRLNERLIGRTMFRAQRTDRPSREADNLYTPALLTGAERGAYEGHVMRSSLYTHTVLHPLRSALVAVGIGAAAGLGLRALRRR